MHHGPPRLFSASASPTAFPTIGPNINQSDVSNWIDSTFSFGLWGTIIYTGIVVGITYLIITILQRQVRKKMGGNLRFFYRLINVAIILIAAILILSTINPLKSLGNAVLASSGIAGVIVGLAAQETLSNVFSGMSLAASKPFEVGEYIELPATSPPISGTVQSISLRHTVLLDVSNRQIVIPNSVLDHDIIERMPTHTQTTPTNVNNFLDVGISYDSDIEKAMKIMSDLVQKQPEFVDVRTDEQKKDGVPVVTVRVMALADSSVNLRATVPTHTLAEGYKALSDLRLLVKKTFDAEGISIPYPYRNVILKDGNEPQQTAAKRS